MLECIGLPLHTCDLGAHLRLMRRNDGMRMPRAFLSRCGGRSFRAPVHTPVAIYVAPCAGLRVLNKQAPRNIPRRLSSLMLVPTRASAGPTSIVMANNSHMRPLIQIRNVSGER